MSGDKHGWEKIADQERKNKTVRSLFTAGGGALKTIGILITVFLIIATIVLLAYVQFIS